MKALHAVNGLEDRFDALRPAWESAIPRHLRGHVRPFQKVLQRLPVRRKITWLLPKPPPQLAAPSESESQIIQSRSY